jgi:uncharacterized protein (DUF2062 family)/2-polyprenyl-3-methyl-5-hydroxy-6-metoxy-1,4-benzoquinol methylase
LTSERRRRGFGRALAELHYELRSEGDTPVRGACAVFLGTLIGCLPFYGTHFVLCMAFAKLAGLSRIKTYLAAHVNNPLTAPFLLALELGVGRVLLTGSWPGFRPADLAEMSWRGVGGALLLGSVAVGLVGGLVLGALALGASLRFRAAPAWVRLADETARRYLAAGVSHWEFVRGKLRHDPMYREIIGTGLPEGGVFLDLGCGRGILLSLVLTTNGSRASGRTLVGVESRETLAAIARLATGSAASVVTADVRTVNLPRSRTLMMLDLLHYLSAADQEDLIRRASAALEPGGVMWIREPDRGRTLRFLATRAGERLACAMRGEWRRPLHYRRSDDWCVLLRREGLGVTTRGASRGTPFAKVLFRCERPT